MTAVDILGMREVSFVPNFYDFESTFQTANVFYINKALISKALTRTVFKVNDVL